MNNRKLISSSSTSKSSSSSASSSSTYPNPNSDSNDINNIIVNTNNTLRPTPRTMEEVWKDINLFSSLHGGDHRHPPPPTTIAAAAHHLDLRGMSLQDFLSRPFAADGSPPAPAPTPLNFLSLNSLPENQHFQPLDVSASANGKKRYPEQERNSGDRRHKRMIKNRESAARSRARKQAYTNELELEVAHLLEENAKLRKQQEQLCEPGSAQFPKKNSLQRTSSSPY